MAVVVDIYAAQPSVADFNHEVADGRLDRVPAIVEFVVEPDLFSAVTCRGLEPTEEGNVVDRDLIAKIRREVIELDAGLVQDVPSLAVDRRVRVVDADVDCADPRIDKSLSTRDLRVVAIGAGLQRREHDGTFQQLRRDALQDAVLGVVARTSHAAIPAADHFTLLDHDRTHIRFGGVGRPQKHSVSQGPLQAASTREFSMAHTERLDAGAPLDRKCAWCSGMP